MIENWLLSLLFSAIASLLTGVINVFASFINNIFEVMYQINVGLKLDTVVNYTVAAGLACVGFAAVKQILEVYVFETEGDSEDDPLELITRVCIAVAMIVCGSWLLEQLIVLAGKLTNDVSGLEIAKKEEDFLTTALTSILGVFKGDSTIRAFVFICLLVAMIVGFCIFVIHAAKRGAELMLYKIMLPIIAVDLLTTNKERWNAFFTECIICVFGYVIQVFCFRIMLTLFNDLMGAPYELKYSLAVLGWLVVVLSTPKWLEKFAYSSGIGNAAKGGMRTATFMLPNLGGKK